MTLQKELGLRIIPIDDVRYRLRTAGPTGTIGKEADCSYLHEELLVQHHLISCVLLVLGGRGASAKRPTHTLRITSSFAGKILLDP